MNKKSAEIKNSDILIQLRYGKLYEPQRYGKLYEPRPALVERCTWSQEKGETTFFFQKEEICDLLVAQIWFIWAHTHVHNVQSKSKYMQGTKELNQRPDLPAKDIFLNLELKDEVFSGELYHDRWSKIHLPQTISNIAYIDLETIAMLSTHVSKQYGFLAKNCIFGHIGLKLYFSKRKYFENWLIY